MDFRTEGPNPAVQMMSGEKEKRGRKGKMKSKHRERSIKGRRKTRFQAVSTGLPVLLVRTFRQNAEQEGKKSDHPSWEKKDRLDHLAPS